MGKLIRIAMTMVLVAALAVPAWAEQGPKEFVQTNLDKFVKILQDPKYKDGADQKEQTDKIWDLLHQTFDFNAVSRRAVGRGWQQFSPAEQKEFSDVFSQLLGENYLRQIREGYTNEKVEVTEEEMLGQRKALVKSNIIRKGAANIPVDYMLWKPEGGWRVYDVKVEGVSLVRNYRAQFSEILLNNPPSALIERVKQKLAEEKAGGKS